MPMASFQLLFMRKMPTKIVSLAKSLIRQANMLLGRLPRIYRSKHIYKMRRIGSVYGGWWVADSLVSSKPVVLSCGLGEDATFDVGFLREYGGIVLIADPTPKAVKYFAVIRGRLGMAPDGNSPESGAVSPLSYDLRGIDGDMIKFLPTAVWNKRELIRFYKPPNPEHVSHSAINFQNLYRTDTPYIEVQADTISGILTERGIGSIDLLKLDIEGAEIEALHQMIQDGIMPRQIMVEYDEMSKPSVYSAGRIKACHNELVKSGYQLIHVEGQNFTYVRNS